MAAGQKPLVFGLDNATANESVKYLFENLTEQPRLYGPTNTFTLLDDTFLTALASTSTVQRLKRIGFLGAIDYLKHGTSSKPNRRRHSRYEHSLGVAELAFRYARILELDTKTTRTLAAAGLLHDIGHGPLSHTLEPVFREIFAIDHHSAGIEYIEGRTRFGNEIRHLLSEHGLAIDEVSDLISGNNTGPHGHLFSSPINIDTIEAITRCCYFIVPGTAPPPCRPNY